MMRDTSDNKTTRHKAVALRYDPDDEAAPRVIAKGAGLTAERIIDVAREHNIHVHNDPELVNVLSKLDVDTLIPEALYVAVAEVLAFVYRLNDSMQMLKR